MADNKQNKKQIELLHKYLSDNLILVCDQSSASRSRISNVMIQLGAKANYLRSFGNYISALDCLKSEQPKVVISDYYLGGHNGFDLIMDYKKSVIPPKDSIFMLITANSSQSAIARAAEEDIDAFILKPYTLESVAESIQNSSIQKLFPSEYVKIIDLGKEHLFKLNFQEARIKFKEAIKLHNQPSLAWYYLAQTEHLEKEYEKATKNYNEGLGLNQIHYKCLIGLYDLLISQEKYNEAYAVIKKVATVFPANPQRFLNVVRIAIMTHNIPDIEQYYKIFKELDERPPELVKAICSGLIILGKHYLMQSNTNRALEIFNYVSVSCGEQRQFIQYIIETLWSFNKVEDAIPYFKRFDGAEQNKSYYRISKFLIESNELKDLDLALEGIVMIKDRIMNPNVFLSTIKALKKAQRPEYTEYVEMASNQWPDKSIEFLSA